MTFGCTVMEGMNVRRAVMAARRTRASEAKEPAPKLICSVHPIARFQRMLKAGRLMNSAMRQLGEIRNLPPRKVPCRCQKVCRIFVAKNADCANFSGLAV